MFCTDAFHATEWGSRPADTAPLVARLAAGVRMLSATLPKLPPQHPHRQAASTWAAVSRLCGALCLLGGLSLPPEGWLRDVAALASSVAALLQCSAGTGPAEQAAAHAALRGLQSRLQGQQAGQQQQQQQHGEENRPAQAQASAGPGQQGQAGAGAAVSPELAAKRARRAARKAI